MKSTWRTLWQQRDIVVFRDEVEVDRLAADRIERVFLLYAGSGDTPGDIGVSLVELADGYVLFEGETGFAGRVNFERQDWWHSRGCVHWIAAASAPLPWRLRLRGLGNGPAVRRLARDELAGAIAAWPVEPAQTWDERKRWRIEKTRAFGAAQGQNAHA